MLQREAALCSKATLRGHNFQPKAPLDTAFSSSSRGMPRLQPEHPLTGCIFFTIKSPRLHLQKVKVWSSNRLLLGCVLSHQGVFCTHFQELSRGRLPCILSSFQGVFCPSLSAIIQASFLQQQSGAPMPTCATDIKGILPSMHCKQ